MAIADSDLYLDFRAASDVDPYTNASLDTFGTGVMIEGNKIKPITDVGGAVLKSSISVTGAVSSECVVSVVAGDPLGPSLINSSGTGWWCRVHYSEVRLRAVTAYAPTGGSLTFDSPGVTDGDVIRIEQASGNISIYKNAVLLSSISDGSATGLRPAYIGSREDSNNSGSNQLGFNYLGAPTGPAINPTGTDTDLINGTSADVVFSGLTSDPASIAVVWDNGVDSAISATQADFSLGTVTAGVATATVTATIGNLPYTDATYLTADYSYLVTCDDDSEITFDTLTFSPATGNSFITVASPVNDSTSILPSETLANGQQLEWPDEVVISESNTATLDVLANGQFTIEWSGAAASFTFTLRFWDGAEWFDIATTINTAGEVVSGGGLTRVGLTRIGLTTAGLTAVGL